MRVLRDNGKPLRVAMLGHKWMPSREGGVEIVVEELSTRMVRRGCKVVCYNRRGHHVNGKQSKRKAMSEYKGVRLKQVLTINRRGVAAVTSSIFGAVRCAFGPYDVVHFHSEGSCAMLWLPKLMGKRCVVTIHGLDHKRAKWGWFASSYIMFGERVAVKAADRIIVLSTSTQDYFKKEYGRKTHFIPNGVNRPQIVEADLIQKKFGLKKNEYILFLGRIVPEKGLRCLIRAFNRVDTDKKLVIAGAASDTNRFMTELKFMSRKDNRIIFTGFVQGKILDELYSNAYFYVLPSDLEGMPLSLLEAMSYGNCCLVSDIPECAEVVEDKAVLFRTGDEDDLCLKLQTFCEDEAMVQKYRTVTADFICQKYNWDRTVDKTLELYH